MQIFKIKEIFPSQEDKKPTVIVDESGAKISGFDTKLRNLSIGTEIEVDLVVKGSYNNIKEWKLVKEGPGSPATAPQQDQGTIKLQINAQYRIAALAQACTLAAAGKIEPADIKGNADKFYTWLIGRVQVAPKAKLAETTAESAEEIWQELGSGTKRDPNSIKNLGNLFTACKQDFNMSPDAVVAELGCNTKEEIKESMPNCYRIISSVREE